MTNDGNVPPPPATPASAPPPEFGHDRMIRGLKTIGISLALIIAGVVVMVIMGSQGLTGKAAIAAVVLVLFGAIGLIRGIVLTIWGAVVKRREG